MGRVTCDVSVTVDGFVTGTNQRLEEPFGDGPGERLHRWQFEQREANAEQVAAILAAGAYVMGRNMFSPGRGDWDESWTGWWGAEPPYRAPVFVLTHYERAPLVMQGGTTFTFVTGGPAAALELARAAAGGKDVSICGGAATVNQYLAAGAIDELRLHVVPLILGAGERLFDGVVDVELEQVSAVQTELVTHLTYRLPPG
jgi:dihydrofolate reductase